MRDLRDRGRGLDLLLQDLPRRCLFAFPLALILGERLRLLRHMRICLIGAQERRERHRRLGAVDLHSDRQFKKRGAVEAGLRQILVEVRKLLGLRFGSCGLGSGSRRFGLRGRNRLRLFASRGTGGRGWNRRRRLVEQTSIYKRLEGIRCRRAVQVSSTMGSRATLWRNVCSCRTHARILDDEAPRNVACYIPLRPHCA